MSRSTAFQPRNGRETVSWANTGLVCAQPVERSSDHLSGIVHHELDFRSLCTWIGDHEPRKLSAHAVRGEHESFIIVLDRGSH